MHIKPEKMKIYMHRAVFEGAFNAKKRVFLCFCFNGFVGIVVDFVAALEFLVERPVNQCKNDVTDEEHNPVVESEADFYVAHGHEHEWPCDEEERELPALVAERVTALVAYDGIHHREAGAKTAHQALDEHEPRNDACNGGRLDVNGKRSLVAHAGFVLLFLEENHADDKVKNASADKVCFAFRDAGVQKCSECNEKREPGNNRRYNWNFYFVMENANDVYV